MDMKLLKGMEQFIESKFEDLNTHSIVFMKSDIFTVEDGYIAKEDFADAKGDIREYFTIDKFYDVEFTGNRSSPILVTRRDCL